MLHDQYLTQLASWNIKMAFTVRWFEILTTNGFLVRSP
jgi:hypothetical protein